MTIFRGSVRGAAIAVLLVLLVAGSAFAQSQTGGIFGTAVDPQGAALPGVTITLTGIGAPRTTVTGSQGEFRFLGLDPGRYTVRASLQGMGDAARTVDMSLGTNAEVTLKLAPAMTEAITVSAEAPLLDVRKAGTGATMTKVELEQLPSARDPWVVLQQVPGVSLDRINVGGNESGQQSIYVSKGARSQQNTWNMDGVAITDMAATGSSPIYFDFDSFEEMQATTGGSDPRIQTPGVQLNLVTKRGTNDIRGSARYLLTDSEFQDDATIPAEAQSYLQFANQITEVLDYGAEVGGPIIRDRLWLWGAYSKNEIDLLAAVGGTRQARDFTLLENYNAKLNTQLFSNNSLVGTYQEGDKIKNGRDVGPTRPPETAWNQSGPTPIWKIEDTHIFSQNFYLTGMISHVGGGFQLVAAGGDDVSYFSDNGVFGRSYFSQYIDRPQDQRRLDGSAFFSTGTMSHELRFGFGYRGAPTNTMLIHPGNQNFHSFSTGQCASLRGTHTDIAARITDQCGLVDLQRNINRSADADYQDLYVGDTMLLNNLTVQVGLRFDRQTAQNTASEIGANPLVPDRLTAVTFGGDEEALEWSSVSPRIGLTYRLGADRPTLLRGSYNRYVDQLGVGVPFAANPTGSTTGLRYVFNDVNGDREAQLNEIIFDKLIAPIAIDPANPNSFRTPTTRIDYDMNPPKTDEFIIGAETELFRQFVIGANATYRNLTDFTWTAAEKTPGGARYTAADYEVAGTVSGTTPGGSAYSVPYYRTRDGVPTPIYGVVENRPDYSQTFRGIELFGTKRLANRWMMRGNIAWNEWTQEVGEEGIQDPTELFSAAFSLNGCSTCDGSLVAPQSAGSGGKGRVFMNSGWSYSLSGLYEAPWGISLGAALTGWEGYPNLYLHRVSGVRNGTSTLAKDLLVEDIGESRNDDIHNVDFRVAKVFSIRALSLTLAADIFNAFNTRPVLQRNNLLFNTATTVNPLANRIEEIQSPRVIRFGARLSF